MQSRDLNMKHHGNVLPTNSHQNNSTSKSKDNELVKMSEKEFRSLPLKMIRDLKEDTNIQINDVRKLIQDLDKKSTLQREI
jgi:hypothetical protein